MKSKCFRVMFLFFLFCTACTASPSTAIPNIIVTPTFVVSRVSVPGYFDFPVVQQPTNLGETENLKFISSNPEELTQFGIPGLVVGILARNHLAGSWFGVLQPNTPVVVTYTNGQTENFSVTEVLKYQALDPESTTSEFVSLETGLQVSSADLAQKVYGGEHHLTLQTSIETSETPHWGRIFVLAYPTVIATPTYIPTQTQVPATPTFAPTTIPPTSDVVVNAIVPAQNVETSSVLNPVANVMSTGLFQLVVTQQPYNDPGFVFGNDGIAAQFSLSGDQVIGILAHNHLSGKFFSSLTAESEINVTFRNGETRTFEVRDTSNIEQYQALDPFSPTSDFLSLSNSQTVTSTELFKRIYTGEHRLVLQTCVEKDGNWSWGRLFVTAYPK